MATLASQMPEDKKMHQKLYNRYNICVRYPISTEQFYIVNKLSRKSYGQHLGVVYLNVTNFHLTAIYNSHALSNLTCFR